MRLHMKEFRHVDNRNYACDTSEKIVAGLNYQANHERLMELVADRKVQAELKKFVAAFRPTHRCKLEIFKSMLAHGVLISHVHMKALDNPDKAVHEIRSHPMLFRHFEKLHNHTPATENLVINLAKAIVYLAYLRDNIGLFGKDNTTIHEQKSDAEKHVLQQRAAMRSLFKNDGDLQAFEAFCLNVAKAAIVLGRNLMGIGHPPDVVWSCHHFEKSCD